jgi:hypothetical protein
VTIPLEKQRNDLSLNISWSIDTEVLQSFNKGGSYAK